MFHETNNHHAQASARVRYGAFLVFRLGDIRQRSKSSCGELCGEDDIPCNVIRFFHINYSLLIIYFVGGAK